ncbi:uncharacterized protein LOC142225125 [Haematobia irritans]|uniref:uncharacterized protein LOC142225125 n=1 Tax=Haematobia irritans TaxID=7368 RepID=UPI003F506A63
MKGFCHALNNEGLNSRSALQHNSWRPRHHQCQTSVAVSVKHHQKLRSQNLSTDNVHHSCCPMEIDGTAQAVDDDEDEFRNDNPSLCHHHHDGMKTPYERWKICQVKKMSDKPSSNIWSKLNSPKRMNDTNTACPITLENFKSLTRQPQHHQSHWKNEKVLPSSQRQQSLEFTARSPKMSHNSQELHQENLEDPKRDLFDSPSSTLKSTTIKQVRFSDLKGSMVTTTTSAGPTCSPKSTTTNTRISNNISPTTHQQCHYQDSSSNNNNIHDHPQCGSEGPCGVAGSHQQCHYQCQHQHLQQQHYRYKNHAANASETYIWRLRRFLKTITAFVVAVNARSSGNSRNTKNNTTTTSTTRKNTWSTADSSTVISYSDRQRGTSSPRASISANKYSLHPLFTPSSSSSTSTSTSRFSSFCYLSTMFMVIMVLIYSCPPTNALRLAGGMSKSSVANKEQLYIGLIAPHTNFGKREYLRAIHTAVSGLNKTRGAKLTFFKDYQFEPRNIRFDMMSLTPSPTAAGTSVYVWFREALLAMPCYILHTIMTFHRNVDWFGQGSELSLNMSQSVTI